jgi:hypothetical protein
MKSHIWMRPIWGADYSEYLANRAESMVPGRIRMRFLPRKVLEGRLYKVHRITSILHSLKLSLEYTPWYAQGDENDHRGQVALATIGRELNRRGIK